MKMISAGKIGKIDNNGRIKIPETYMKSLRLKPNDFIEIFLGVNDMVLTKCHNECTVCGNIENILLVDGKMFCRDCVEKIKQLNEE